MQEHRLYIGGDWRRGGAGTAQAVSPSSGRTFASVAVADAGDVDAAVAAASAASQERAGTSAFDRAAWCERIVAGIRQRREELASVLTLDQGKPLAAEAYDEVDELAAMGAELIAPAMAAGNAIVWVPAPTTTACCAALAQVIADSGLPAGVFNFVCGPGAVVGDALAGHRGVAGVGFVGSVATGASVAARAAGKAQVLELGGNGPMVVLADADLDLAVDAALEAGYLCAGQSCTAGERFLVHADVRAPFVERVVAATKDRVCRRRAGLLRRKAGRRVPDPPLCRAHGA
jgi:acyl-CoA reductase-like NAD-dependent aldehyde dehydrogenase